MELSSAFIAVHKELQSMCNMRYLCSLSQVTEILLRFLKVYITFLHVMCTLACYSLPSHIGSSLW